MSKMTHLFKQVSIGLSGGIACGLVCSFPWASDSQAQAAAKAPAPLAPPSCGVSGAAPSLKTPQPIRPVLLQPIGVKAFQLPNGANVDLGMDLQSMLTTVVTSTSAWTPIDPASVTPSSPCSQHLEIRAAVTNFQLNVASAGVTFGFTPTGSLGGAGAPTVNGAVQVNLGTISIDFSAWACDGIQCSAFAASTATQLTAGVSASVNVDFSVATTAGNFLYGTPMGEVLRKIMINGINRLTASPRLNELPWQAEVKEYIPAAGLVIFDQGQQSGLGVNQTFQLYVPTNTQTAGHCEVFQVEADVHTIEVDTVSSTAVIDQSQLGSRGILPGDVVMIHYGSSQ